MRILTDAPQVHSFDRNMLSSRLITVVLACALMFSNIACACASTDAASNDTHHVAGGHHHGADTDVSGHMPCEHLDCPGCDDPQDACAATPDYVVVSAERDHQTPLTAQLDFDSGDDAFIDSVTDRSSSVLRKTRIRFQDPGMT